MINYQLPRAFSLSHFGEGWREALLSTAEVVEVTDIEVRIHVTTVEVQEIRAGAATSVCRTGSIAAVLTLIDEADSIVARGSKLVDMVPEFYRALCSGFCLAGLSISSG